jgi:YVTN family beta-propeller protein
VTGALLVLGLAALAAWGLRPSRPGRPHPTRLGPAAFATTRGDVPAPAVSGRVVHQGVEVVLTIHPLRRTAADTARPALREGDDVVVRVRIADTTTQAPLKDVHPAAWLTDRESGPTDPKTCAAKAQVLIGGSLLNPPEIDLNVYHIVTLNEDATLTVVDPRFSFGGSKLLALVPLAGTGQDWALNAGETRLFVSMPEVGKVAVVDTSSWKVLDDLDVGALPTRLVAQPDGRFLWLAHDPSGALGGSITVIDAETRKVAGTVAVGRGPHEIAFRADGRYAFVTDTVDGFVSVVDARALRTVARVAAGARPASIAYSPLADMVYVADPVGGAVTVIDAERHRVVARVAAGPGVGRVAFAPGDRFGFLVNPQTGMLSILDASVNRVIQTAKLREGPDQIAFSNDFAYIRHRGTEQVVMVPLAKVGDEGRPVPTVDFPAGQNPLGKTSRPTPAAAVVQAPGENAVLVANPSDKSVYYYKEGMAAPMGNFTNYKREPRAVLVVDRSLREHSRPGEYETVARLRRSGAFDLVFFLDTPRIVHCFPVDVAQDPVLSRERDRLQTDVALLDAGRVVTVGEPTALRFRLTHRGTGAPRTALKDVSVLAFSPGGWQARPIGRESAGGVYTVEFIPPEPGVYYVSVGCESLGLARNRTAPVILHAVPGDPADRLRADGEAQQAGGSDRSRPSGRDETEGD